MVPKLTASSAIGTILRRGRTHGARSHKVAPTGRPMEVYNSRIIQRIFKRPFLSVTPPGGILPRLKAFFLVHIGILPQPNQAAQSGMSYPSISTANLPSGRYLASDRGGRGMEGFPSRPPDPLSRQLITPQL